MNVSNRSLTVTSLQLQCTQYALHSKLVLSLAFHVAVQKQQRINRMCRERCATLL